MTAIEISDAGGRSVLGYVPSRILRVLAHSASKYGMCVCHVAARTHVLEARLYEPLSQLIAMYLVDINPADEPPRETLVEANKELDTLLSDTRSAVRGQDAASAADRWLDFFKAVGRLDKVPRYYVHIAPRGRARLRKEWFHSLLAEFKAILGIRPDPIVH